MCRRRPGAHVDFVPYILVCEYMYHADAVLALLRPFGDAVDVARVRLHHALEREESVEKGLTGMFFSYHT